jgi:hypothetical protein
MRVPDWRSVRKTGSGSPGDTDITFSTSMVADCWSMRSPYSLLRVANASASAASRASASSSLSCNAATML